MDDQTFLMKYKYRYGDKLQIVLEDNKLKILQSVFDEESGIFYPEVTISSISITYLKEKIHQYLTNNAEIKSNL